MNIDIRRLAPDLVEDYAAFFDTTPHNEKYHLKCYCVYWCSGNSEGKDFNTKAARRNYAIQCVKDGRIQGYLAYADGKVAGWCNANTKADCLTCRGWQGMNGKRKGFIPMEQSSPELRVKSVFCFVIAPEMRRQGIASQLLARVCRDAAEEGFDFIEAYPEKEVAASSEDFMGYVGMYERLGFTVYHETSRKLVMRKVLKD